MPFVFICPAPRAPEKMDATVNPNCVQRARITGECGVEAQKPGTLIFRGYRVVKHWTVVARDSDAFSPIDFGPEPRSDS